MNAALEALLSRGLVPDQAVRWAIRRRLARRLREERGQWSRRGEKLESFMRDLGDRPVAVETEAANRQHYELPPAFFETVLGPHLKYSSGYWPQSVASLADSEAAMLDLYCERARLQDGQRVLDLGCGWGSLALFVARRHPRSQVTAVSNSRRQGRFIRDRARQWGLTNIEVVRADINDFHSGRRYDRILSVEMFEHLKNYPSLMSRIANWLEPQGLLFVHMFVHRDLAYHFDVRGPGDWMARHFFTGGTMVSDDLLPRVAGDLALKQKWKVSGCHYQQTSNAWLRQMDSQREAILPLFEQTYGAEQARRWWVRWRLFFMACAEMFGYRGGEEWWVSHYLFELGT